MKYIYFKYISFKNHIRACLFLINWIIFHSHAQFSAFLFSRHPCSCFAYSNNLHTISIYIWKNIDNISFVHMWMAASEQILKMYLSKVPWSRGNMFMNSFIQYAMFVENIFFSLGLIVQVYRVIWKKCKIYQIIGSFLTLLYLFHWKFFLFLFVLNVYF